MIELRGKVAVVTGAASGIGLACAKALAKEGVSVAILDVRKEHLDSAVEEVRALGTTAIGVPTDVSDIASVEAAAAAAIEAFGKIHILVNSAGVFLRGPCLFEVDDKVWDWMLGVNIYGAVHCCRAFIPHMARHGEGGHVMNIGSMSGFLSANRQTGVYTTTKFAQLGLAQSLADEVRDMGISVSIVLPAAVNTDLYVSSAQLRGELGGANEFAATPSDTAAGMSADEVAARAIAGMKAGQFFIPTHPQFRLLHEEQHRALMAAYDAAEAWKPAQPF